MKLSKFFLAAIAALSIGGVSQAQSPPFNAYSISTLGGNCSQAAAIPYQSTTGLTLCSNAGSNGQVMYLVGGVPSWQTVAGTGTVTSVGLTLPSIFSLTGSPVTAAGTFAATLASQAANTAFLAPNGSAGAPTFRAMVAADLPSVIAGSQTAKTVYAAPNGSAGTPSFRALLTSDIPTGTSGTNIPLLSTDNVFAGSQTVGVPITNWLVGALAGTVTYNSLNVTSKPQAVSAFSTMMSSSRTSDNLNVVTPQNVISESAFMLHDNTTIAHMGWARYTVTEITPTAVPSLTLGEENSIENNNADAPWVDPFNVAAGSNPTGAVINHRSTSGTGPASNLISAYYNGNWNGGKARAGLVFGSDSLDTTGGYAPAVSMAYNQGLSWYKSTGNLTWRQFANSNAGDSQIVMGNNTYDMYLASSASNPLKISTTGVGINGQVAAYPLDVNGAARASQFLARPGTQVLSTCGTSFSLASFSNKHGGKFTTGTGTVNSCTLTFDTTFPNAAFCTVTPATAAAPAHYISTQAATGFTVTFAASAPSTTWQYVCMGA